MSAVEKVYLLWARELRLLGRSRGRMVRALLLPFICGLFAGRFASNEAASFCLFVILPVCMLLYAGDSRRSGGRERDLILSALVPARILFTSWLLAALVLAVIQAGIFSAVVAIPNTGLRPDFISLAAVVGFSLAVGCTAYHLLPPD